MNYWEDIINILQLPTTTMLYIGIGSSMERYDEITQSNNQQYPCFLNKFEGRHLVVLIDPEMEPKLKLCEYFNQENDPLTLIDQKIKTNLPSDDNDIEPKFIERRFANSKGDFFILNDHFYFETSPYMDSEQNQKAILTRNMLFNLVSIVVNKTTQCKMICQDYSGRDTSRNYIEMFNFFDHSTLISRVCFDVTQNDGGCFIEIRPDMCNLDKSGNFIQEKYQELVKYSKSQFYLGVLKTRIDALLYPITWNYTRLLSHDPNNEEPYVQVYLPRVNDMRLIYRKKYCFSETTPHCELKTYYLDLILTMLNDIVESREITSELVKYLMDNINNRTLFTNTLSVLKYE